MIMLCNSARAVFVGVLFTVPGKPVASEKGAVKSATSRISENKSKNSEV